MLGLLDIPKSVGDFQYNDLIIPVSGTTEKRQLDKIAYPYVSPYQTCVDHSYQCAEDDRIGREAYATLIHINIQCQIVLF